MNKKIAGLAFKPDFEEAVKRWEAFYEGEIIDRPVVRVYSRRKGYNRVAGPSYHESVFGNMDAIIEKAVLSAEATFFWRRSYSGIYAHIWSG